MKKIIRTLAILVTAVMAAAMIPVTASAGSFSEAKEGVVYIESYFTAPDNSTYIWSYGNSYYYQEKGTTKGFRGSGFAIGNEGESVQYIVTNAHVVLDETADGIRSLDPLNATLNVASQKAGEVRVYFSYGANDFMRAQIYMVDESKDICILKLPQTTDKRKPLIPEKNDKLLMCSDGVYNALSSDELSEALSYPAGEAAVKIENLVISKGYSNQDNFTAVVLEFFR